MNQKRAKWLRWGLPILVLALAVGITMALFAFKQPPQQSEPKRLGPVVETTVVHREVRPLKVHGYGNVMPARRAWIHAEVEGKVVELNPAVRPGGRVEEGELLVQIDPRVYRYRLAEAEGQLAQAKAQLAQEEGRQDVAELDWEYYQENVEEQAQADRSLALRVPQMQSARAQVETAKAQRDRAQLQLEKTRIEAPFDGFIRQEQVGLGQLVTPQSQLVELIGNATFWVEASLPVKQLDRIHIPGFNTEAEQGSAVRVIQQLGAQRIERQGHVSRLYGDLDENGRMARILIEVDDPLRLDSTEAAAHETPALPLLLSAYVEVVIDTPAQENLVKVPWRALREGDEVYVFRDGKMQIQPIEIAWQTPEALYVAEGLQDGDRLVISPISNPVDGMKLRRAEQVRQSQGGNTGQNATAADQTAHNDNAS